ncbi:PAS domain-containing sensor histidine kinase [Cerasicoccus fimbriatus]|uniref:PAS domain-containing sensor histidine kinase n=1 Tax=Cerasicoccus fimbriatus TaxID=3014554 RepID=UPI0022B39AA9|nr:PAS domain-containing sensor histidine kinase [Cerasicoccus sp. TK19100]
MASQNSALISKCPVATGISLLTGVMSLLVLVGWITESRVIVQIAPGLAPMQATTAIGFFLFSACIFPLAASPQWNRWHIERIAAVLFVIWTALNLLQHALGADLGIDRILGEPFIADNSPAPGRMSLMTAMCFGLASMATLISTIGHRSPKLEVPIVFLASLTLGVSGAALFCYVLDVPQAVWLGKRFSEMAILTASGFFLLSAALIMQRFKCGRALYQGAFRWMWAPVLVNSLIAVGIIFLAFHSQSVTNQIEVANVRANVIANTLRSQDTQLEQALRRMTRRATSPLANLESLWEHDALYYIRDFPSLKYIRLTEELSQADWGYPNELTLVYNDWLDEHPPADLLESGKSVTLTGDEATDKICYWVMEDTRMAGRPTEVYLMAVIDASEFAQNAIQQLGTDLSQIFDYSIRPYVPDGSAESQKLGPGKTLIYLSPSFAYYVDVEPQYNQGNQQAETVFLMGGVVMSFVLALLTHLLYLNRKRYQDIEVAQLALNRQKDRLEAYVKHAPAAVAMFDRRMRYVALSQRWKKDYGLLDRDVVGKSHYDVFPNISDEWKEIHRRCLAGEEMFNDRDQWRPEGWDHDQYLRWEIRPWYQIDDSIGGIMMFTEDITQSVLREQELIEMREKADSANRAKTNFLANMSHEIRTPMNSILGFSELLADEVKEPRQAQFLKSIQTSGKALLSLINDLLDLAKIEAGKIDLEYKPVNLHQTVNDLLAIFQLQAESKGIELIAKTADNIPDFLILDSFHLQQVLLNLMSNAVKFTKKGSVTVNVSCQQRGEKYDLYFEVIDTGCGIPDSFRERAFGKFEQAGSGSHGGTGLGLAISAKLVTLMGGEINYTSKLGHGTKFFFNLHNVSPASPSYEQNYATRDIKNLQFPATKILVVDDVRENIDLVEAVFEQIDAVQIITANNGNEGLAMAKQHHPDMILLDISMPDIDGTEVCQQLRELEAFQSTPIVAITASLQKSNSDLSPFGFSECLFKPIPPQLLINTCHRWLKGATIRSNTPSPMKIEGQESSKPPVNLPEPVAQEFREQIAHLQGGVALKDIEDFAEKLLTAGQKHQCEFLTGTAQQLKLATQSFDILGARQCLQQLSNHLKNN